MLPRCPDNASQAKSSLEGKLDCMSLNGYSYTARENVDLNRYCTVLPVLCGHVGPDIALPAINR